MVNGIVGSTGFIGQNLALSIPNLVKISREELRSDKVFELDTLLIAAPSAKKYLANLNPGEDLAEIKFLAKNIKKIIKANKVILFSTVDVYKNATESDEGSACRDDGDYGGNRRYFEDEILKNFEKVYIRRLAGLYGPFLKKNIVFDLIHNRQEQLKAYNPESTFQMMSIGKTIQISLDIESFPHRILNVVSEPIAVKDFTDHENWGVMKGPQTEYRVKSIHSNSGYFQTKHESIWELKQFLSVDDRS